MQTNNQGFRINFTSIPLNNVKIKKLGQGRVWQNSCAKISRLEAENEKDISLIKSQLQNWYKENPIVEFFCDDFLTFDKGRNYEYYVLRENDTQDSKILGVFSGRKKIKDSETLFSLSYLITNPEFYFKKATRDIKGVGDVLFSKVFQRAEEINADSVDFYSSNDRFYENFFEKFKIKYSKINNQESGKSNSFIIKKENFKDGINAAEKKYDFLF